MYFGRIIGLSLTYRFGGYKAKQHEEVDTSDSGNKSRKARQDHQNPGELSLFILALYFTFTSITFFAASALEPPTNI